MKSLGDTFLYSIPARATKGNFRPVKTIAWKTPTPGLIVTVSPAGQSHGLMITHEASGFGLLCHYSDFEFLEGVAESCAILGEQRINWRQPNVVALYKDILELPEDEFNRVHFLLGGGAVDDLIAARARVRDWLSYFEEHIRTREAQVAIALAAVN